MGKKYVCSEYINSNILKKGVLTKYELVSKLVKATIALLMHCFFFILTCKSSLLN
jgi:hypothetical protein